MIEFTILYNQKVSFVEEEDIPLLFPNLFTMFCYGGTNKNYLDA